MADSAADSNALAMREIVKDASRLREHRKTLEQLRITDVREWQLNREFYLGNQWVYYNKEAQRIDTLGVDEGDKPRYKVRLTINETTPATQQLIAQMTKTRPVIRAVPETSSNRDLKAAEFADGLYEHLWNELGLSPKLNAALTHAQLSAGYWLITYDPLAGTPIKVMLNPYTGQPMADDEHSDAFKEELRLKEEQAGMPAGSLVNMLEKTLYVGDIRVHVLDGPRVWVDPTQGTFEDARYAICQFDLPVDEIEARWNKKFAPDNSSGRQAPGLMMQTVHRDDRPKNVRRVFFLYHRPGPTLPKGAYVVWTESPNEILASSDWPYPFTDLPLVKFPGIARPGEVYDQPRGNISRPLQKELNNKVSKAAEHINLTMRPQMIAPVGSLTQRLTDEPGAVFPYNPIAGMKPEWRPIPALPPQIQQWIADMQSRIDRVYNVMPTSREQLPARADSGQLVELVQEATADQLSPEIMRMEQSLARAGKLMASYAKAYYTETRMLKISGPGGSFKYKKFLNSDLEGGFDFQAEAGSGLPRTRAGQFQQIQELMQMQLISPREALIYLPVSGLKTVQARLAADEDFANRKIEKLIRGEPVNVPALQQALAAVKSGVNPDTQQFFMSPDEAQFYVEQAAMSPQPFEDLETSIYVIGQFMKSPEFEGFGMDVQQRFYQHFTALMNAVTSRPQVTDPVKTTLSLKGTVGPTVAAEILQRGGIQGATPETMAEPPLETSVYDSIDQPDADDAGNDALSAAETLQSMEHAENKNTVALSQDLQNLAASRQQADMDVADRLMQASRAEEVHQQRLANMRRPAGGK